MSAVIRGDDALIEKIKKIGKEAYKETRKSLNANTTEFKTLIQKDSSFPVKTGALSRSMGTYIGQPKGDTLLNVIGVRSSYVDKVKHKRPICYAQRVEDKQHFAQSIFDANVEAIKNNILNDVLRRINTI